MKNWRACLAPRGATIVEAIKTIDASGLQIALIVDENEKLLGTLTDGDVRRAILKGISLAEPVELIMNKNPRRLGQSALPEEAEELMQRYGLHHIPIVNTEGRIVGMRFSDELGATPSNFETPVVLMAGGLGSRLAPLTDDMPKPMLKVGDKPILETILESFISHGFRRFFISVNYKSDQIKSHFGNGDAWGVSIQYLEETKRLGTAGALKLLPPSDNGSLLVMNGDLLTKVNFAELLKQHTDNGAFLTTCIRQSSMQIPYGVVEYEGNVLLGIREKPVEHFFINAGIYALRHRALEHIPEDVFFDMPSLILALKKLGSPLGVFPIREYWIDIGHMAEYQRANEEYRLHF